jgi:hypothetical protein
VRNRHSLRLLLANPEKPTFPRLLRRPGHGIADLISLLTGCAFILSFCFLLPREKSSARLLHSSLKQQGFLLSLCRTWRIRGATTAWARRLDTNGTGILHARTTHSQALAAALFLLGGVRCGDQQHGNEGGYLSVQSWQFEFISLLRSVVVTKNMASNLRERGPNTLQATGTDSIC